MRRARALALSLAGATTTFVPAIAKANGRFPDAQQLVVDARDEAHIAVQTTYGFIHTTDHGAHWYWTCEDAASYGGILDPPIAIVEGGALIAGVFDGLVVSSPDACTYAFAGGELAQRFFLDVSTMKQDPSHAIALSSDGKGSNMFDTRVWKTTDAAVSWSQLGAALPTSFLAFTLDAAPDDEDLLYVSGFTVLGSDDYQGSLAISTDAGATWTIKPIAGSGNDSGPYIAAIDPNDHDTLYVRLASLQGKLLVTHDAGDTFTEVFAGQGTLLGFALSPDGGELRFGGDTDGLYRASADDLPASVEKMSDLALRCLTWTDAALYACAREAFAGFTVGESFDGGQTFQAIHHLQCLDGPDPACDASSTIETTCTGPWGAQKQILGTETCASGTGGAGEGGAGGAGGAGSADGPAEEGCACSHAGRSASGEGGAAMAAIAFAIVTRARRRPRRR